MDREAPRPIKLAQAALFRIGTLDAAPAARELSVKGRTKQIEPRVMQVLVALADPPGRIVGREELIVRCWGGRIVEDSAINRAISRLRHIIAELGAEDVAVETVARVGYRLDVTEPRNAAHSRVPRRAVIAAGGATAVMGAGTWLWWYRDGSEARAEARQLVRRAQDLMVSDDWEDGQQARAFLERAARLDPAFAAAWGGLALSLADWGQGAETGAAARVDALAARALALDPDDESAIAARVLVKPRFRRWVESTAEARAALARHPGNWRLRARLAVIAADTGQWREADAGFANIVARQPLAAGPRYHAIAAAWASGNTGIALDRWREALGLFPRTTQLFDLGVVMLHQAGRDGVALKLARDIDPRAASTMAMPPDLMIAVIKSRSAGGQARAAEDIQARRASKRMAGHAAIEWLTLLGAVDAAFAEADMHFVAAPAQANRNTAVLFRPTTARLRSDPRFATLTRSLGLDAYWRALGRQPDYRG